MRLPTFVLISVNNLDTIQSFTTNYNNVHISNNKFSRQIQKNNEQYNTRCISSSLGMTIVSPFDNTATKEGDELSAPTEQSYNPLPSDDEPLDLTWDNVDMVLDEMRPYLLQDGGNVAISEIDGPIVRLELQVCIMYLFSIAILKLLENCYFVHMMCAYFFFANSLQTKKVNANPLFLSF